MHGCGSDFVLNGKVPSVARPQYKRQCDQVLKRFDKFLHAPAPGVASLREAICTLEDKSVSAYIVGGLPRELAMHGPSISVRDVDVVVEQHDLTSTLKLLGNNQVGRTRFGGYRLLVDEFWRVDLWTVQSAWAFHKFPLLFQSANDLMSSTFFNLDAIGIALSNRIRPRHIIEHRFFDGLSRNLIDINFKPNPFPLVCGTRALIMADRYSFALSPGLASFVRDLYNVKGLNAFIEAQVSHYKRRVVPDSMLQLWLSYIRSNVYGTSPVYLPGTHQNQLGLFTPAA